METREALDLDNVCSTHTAGTNLRERDMPREEVTRPGRNRPLRERRRYRVCRDEVTGKYAYFHNLVEQDGYLRDRTNRGSIDAPSYKGVIPRPDTYGGGA
jgi:hypothetical protein